MPVPELDEEPTLEGGLPVAAWSAFAALSDSRPISVGGAGAIPISEIEAYCRLIGLDDAESRAALLRLLRRIDRAFLAHQSRAEERNDG
jgi:hypothetical protein